MLPISQCALHAPQHCCLVDDRSHLLDLLPKLCVPHLGQKQAQGLNTFLIEYLQTGPFPVAPGWLTMQEVPAGAMETLYVSHWK